MALIDIAFGFVDLGASLVRAHAFGIDSLGQLEQSLGDRSELGLGPWLSRRRRQRHEQAFVAAPDEQREEQ